MTDAENSREALLKEVDRLRTRLEELENSAGKREGIERAPQESAEEFRILFENLGVGALVIEDDLTVSLVNKEFERLAGYSREEIQREKSGPRWYPPKLWREWRDIISCAGPSRRRFPAATKAGW